MCIIVVDDFYSCLSFSLLYYFYSKNNENQKTGLLLFIHKCHCFTSCCSKYFQVQRLYSGLLMFEMVVNNILIEYQLFFLFNHFLPWNNLL